MYAVAVLACGLPHTRYYAPPFDASSTANSPKSIDYKVRICTGHYHQVGASCSISIQFVAYTYSTPAQWYIFPVLHNDVVPVS